MDKTLFIVRKNKCSLNCLQGAVLFSEYFTRLVSLNPRKPTRLCLRSIIQESDFEMERYVQKVYVGMPLGSMVVGSEGLGTRTEGGLAKPGSCR